MRVPAYTHVFVTRYTNHAPIYSPKNKITANLLSFKHSRIGDHKIRLLMPEFYLGVFWNIYKNILPIKAYIAYVVHTYIAIKTKNKFVIKYSVRLSRFVTSKISKQFFYLLFTGKGSCCVNPVQIPY